MTLSPPLGYCFTPRRLSLSVPWVVGIQLANHLFVEEIENVFAGLHAAHWMDFLSCSWAVATSFARVLRSFLSSMAARLAKAQSLLNSERNSPGMLSSQIAIFASVKRSRAVSRIAVARPVAAHWCDLDPVVAQFLREEALKHGLIHRPFDPEKDIDQRHEFAPIQAEIMRGAVDAVELARADRREQSGCRALTRQVAVAGPVTPMNGTEWVAITACEAYRRRVSASHRAASRWRRG